MLRIEVENVNRESSIAKVGILNGLLMSTKFAVVIKYKIFRGGGFCWEYCFRKILITPLIISLELDV